MVREWGAYNKGFRRCKGQIGRSGITSSKDGNCLCHKALPVFWPASQWRSDATGLIQSQSLVVWKQARKLGRQTYPAPHGGRERDVTGH